MFEKRDSTKEGLEILLTFFSNKKNSLAMVTAMLDEVKELEDELFKFLSDFSSLDSMYGFMLDNVGAWIGVAREDRDDNDYRVAIYTQAFINSSRGRPRDVIGFLRQVTNSGRIAITPLYPAGFQVAIDGDDIPETLEDTLGEVAAAGVTIDIVLNNSGGRYFGLKDGDAPLNPSFGGLADADRTPDQLLLEAGFLLDGIN